MREGSIEGVIAVKVLYISFFLSFIYFNICCSPGVIKGKKRQNSSFLVAQ
jgi:hypothetical protein